MVEESLSIPRGVAMTTRRHDISRTLLTRWGKEYRDGLLGREPSVAFAPVNLPVSRRSDLLPWNWRQHATQRKAA